MSINEDILKGLATEQSFNRGVSYFEDGSVDDMRKDGDWITATVLGSRLENYEVKLNLSNPSNYFCSCPYDFGGACKHVVALGLAWLNERDSFRDADEERSKIKAELTNFFTELSKEDLINICIDFIIQEPENKLKIIEYLEKKNSVGEGLRIEKLKYLTEEALRIIAEFNCYGGGDETEEMECYDYMDEIIEILDDEDENVPKPLRKEIMERFMEEYLKYNSGFEDIVRDVIFTAAVDDDDWYFIVDKLEKTSSDYDRELVMGIYLHHLNDEEKYLQLRREKLEYGTDYYDLVNYYEKKGDMTKAVETAKLGEENGKGRIIDNIMFLKDYYIQQNDYSGALEYHIKAFKEMPTYEGYKETLDFCETGDKAAVRNDLIEHLQSKTKYGYPDLLSTIYYNEGNYEKVMDYVLKGTVHPGKYEQMLLKKYPHKMVDYYKNIVERQINAKKRNSYREGARIALKIKNLYTTILNRPEEWDKYIQGILHKYPRHRALQEEFGKYL